MDRNKWMKKRRNSGMRKFPSYEYLGDNRHNEIHMSHSEIPWCTACGSKKLGRSIRALQEPGDNPCVTRCLIVRGVAQSVTHSSTDIRKDRRIYFDMSMTIDAHCIDITMWPITFWRIDIMIWLESIVKSCFESKRAKSFTQNCHDRNCVVKFDWMKFTSNFK